MMIMFRCAIFGLIFLVLQLSSSPAIAGYFPSRPANAQLQTFSGVIAYYSTGEAMGFVGLTSAGVTTAYHLGSPVTINGTVVRCPDATPALKSTVHCTDWPASIKLGVTSVTIKCWSDTSTGSAVPYCDEIDT